jgi:hypothetical protein
VRLEGLGKFKKKISDLFVNPTRDLPACSIVSHPTTLPNRIINLIAVIIRHVFIFNSYYRLISR